MDIVTVRTARAAAAFVLLSLAPQARAGGYLLTNAGSPMPWGTSNIVLNCDLGTLGTLSNAAANTLVTNAVARWNNSQIPECSLNITLGAQLTNDNASVNGTAANNPDFFSPGVKNVVIYDQSGFLTDSQLGAGTSQFVLGFAGPSATSGNNIVRGRAVLNGLFLDGAGSPTDVTTTQFQGVATHEIGHFLCLDHAVCNDGFVNSVNDFTGYPTMYPLVHANIDTLAADDIAWITDLYPSASGANLTKITGTARNNANALLNGVNIVARRADDANGFKNAITCVSGYRDTAQAIGVGEFKLPALPKNSQWVIGYEQIPASYSGGSSTGVVDPPLVLPGPVEFVSESAVETGSDSITRSTTFVTPNVNGGSLANAALRLNPVSSTTNAAEVDTGNAFPADVQSLATVPGVPIAVAGIASVEIAEGGSLNLSGDLVEDWYMLAPVAGQQIDKITLSMSGGVDADMYAASWTGSGAPSFVGASENAGNGVSETIETQLITNRLGSGAGAGKLYIAVNRFSGTGTYTLGIQTSVSPDDAVVVTGTPSGTVDPTAGSVVVQGKGFKNTGGTPTVTFSNSGIQVNSVAFNSATQLTVNVTRLGGFIVGSTTDIEVANPAGSGGYSGRRVNEVITAPVAVSSFDME